MKSVRPVLLAILTLVVVVPALPTLPAQAAQPAQVTSKDFVPGPIELLSQRVGHKAATLNAPSQPSCVNNDCAPTGAHLYDSGGSVLTNPTVYLVNFTDTVGSLSPSTGYLPQLQSTTAPNEAGAAMASLSSPYTDWWSEYMRGASYQGATYGGSINVYDPLLADYPVLNAISIENQLNSDRISNEFPAWNENTVFVLNFRSGQVITEGASTSQNAFCAYHSSLIYYNSDNTQTSLNYAVMPNESGNPGCDFTSATASDFDNFTPVLSHELAEIVTDPTVPMAFFDLINNAEIGDLCEGGNGQTAAGAVSYQGQSYFLQNLWSNAANACITTQIPTTLTSSLQGTTATSKLTSNTAPMYGALITASVGGTTYATATTDSSGSVSLSLVGAPAGSTVTLAYAGSAAASGSSSTVTLPTVESLKLSGPSIARTGASVVITATTSPPAASAPVTLTGGTTSLSATTNASGIATFSFDPDRGATTYTGTLTYKGKPTTATLSVDGIDTATASVTMTGLQTLSVHLSDSLDPIPSAALTISSGSTTLEATTDTNGSATVTLPGLAPGAEVTVSFAGSTVDASATAVVTVPSPESLSFSGPTSALLGTTSTLVINTSPALSGAQIRLDGGPTSATATTNAAGQATFSVTPTSVGVTNYTATLNYLNTSATAPLTFTTQRSSKITITAPTSNSTVKVAQRVTVTASVNASGGSVEFFAGSTPISGCSSVTVGSGLAVCSTAALPAGTHEITAAYSGTATIMSSVSSAIALRVIKSTLHLSLGWAPSSPVVGKKITFTITGLAKPATGTVTISTSNGVVCQVAVSESTSLACVPTSDELKHLVVGKIIINVSYSGDDRYLPWAGAVSLTIKKR